MYNSRARENDGRGSSENFRTHRLITNRAYVKWISRPFFREKIDETTTDRFHRPTGRAWLSMTRWTGSGQVDEELGSNTYSIWDTRDIVWSINLNFREDVHGDGEEKTNGLSFVLTLKNSFFHIRFFLSLRKFPYFFSKQGLIGT